MIGQFWPVSIPLNAENFRFNSLILNLIDFIINKHIYHRFGKDVLINAKLKPVLPMKLVQTLSYPLHVFVKVVTSQDRTETAFLKLLAQLWQQRLTGQLGPLVLSDGLIKMTTDMHTVA